MSEKCKWVITANRVHKVVNIMVEGSFTTEKAKEFVKDYQSKVAGLNAKEYTLQFDCKQLALAKADRVKDLEECFLLYKETGFKNVTFEIEKNLVLKMQLNRLARQTGLINSEVVEIGA